jgi:putative ABC transport system substrate-binding protein
VLSAGVSTEPATLAREPFLQGLRDLGWTPGSNVTVEHRYAEGKVERLPELAAELVRQRVDVIVTRGSQATRAAKEATGTIPIVMSAVADPVRQGFIPNLARPGGNITGLAWLALGQIEGKHLELLKETTPGLRRVAILQSPTAIPDPEGLTIKGIKAAANTLGLEIQFFEVSQPEAIVETFGRISRARVGALLVRPDPAVLDTNRARIAELALSHRLPAIYPWRHYVDSGGLMSYNTHIPDFHRRAATYVDRLLKGAKPGDLPIEQPTKYELVINLKAAKALGLTIPPSLLQRADQVIE